MKHWADKLTDLHACGEAVGWAKDYSTSLKAWKACERGDWLLWIAGRVNIDRKLLVTAACACAKLSLQYVPAGEERPRISIETALKWVNGDSSLEEVMVAADAAYATANAADAAYARSTTLKECAVLVKQTIQYSQIKKLF